MTWEYYIIPLTAFIASLLTFFSGFGLGTILTPVFAIFFPIELAIVMTAIVHFLNNIFKFFLIGRNTRKDILLKFGISGFIGAILGSWLLISLDQWDLKLSFYISGMEQSTTLINMVIGCLIIIFSLFELIPYLRNYQFSKSWVIPGGALSGFFGGVSGHQGALRSAFLIKYGLNKEQFIATGIAIALLIDVARISIYGTEFINLEIMERKDILFIAMISSFIGATLGRQLLKKVKLKSIELLVGAFLLIMGLLISIGIV